MPVSQNESTAGAAGVGATAGSNVVTATAGNGGGTGLEGSTGGAAGSCTDCVLPANIVLTDLSPPVINDNGTIACVARLVGPGVTSRDDYALLVDDGSSTSVVARSGQQIPGGGGVFEPLPGDAIGPFRGAPRLDDDGEIAFLGAFNPSQSATYASDLAVFVGARRRVAPGEASPDYPARRFFFDPEQSNPPALGPDGSFAVGLTLEGDGFDTATHHDAGLYRGTVSGTELVPVAHRGDVVPGGAFWFQYPPGAGDWLGFGPPGINGSGAIAFFAREQAIDVSGVGPYGNGFSDALYVDSGALSRRVRSGDPSPDGAGTLDAMYDVKHSPAINDSGDVVFLASAAGDGVIVRSGASSQEVIAREGASAPGGGVYSHLCWQPSLNDAGEVAFVADLRQSALATGSIGEAIFLGPPSALREIVRTGDSTPEADATFSELGVSNTYSQVNGNRPSLNRNGELAFMASLRFADGSLGLGLYVFDGSRIVTVARTGDVIDGKTIADIGANTVTSPGVRAFNDSCDVAFVVRYTDGSSAIWVVNGCSP